MNKEKSIFIRKIICRLSALFMLFIICILCFLATKVVLKIEDQENDDILEEPIKTYGQQGLPMGIELEEEPELIEGEYIYFSDRILKQSNYGRAGNTYTAEAIKDLMNTMPVTVSKYVMLIPSRIAYEPSVSEDTDNCLEAIKEIYSQMPEDVMTLDVDSVLKKHSDEYIYLRTDVDLTSLGAYYSSKLFCEEKGWDVVDLESYFEYRLEDYAGVFTLLEKSNIREDALDYIAYYMKKDIKNWQTITVRKKGGIFETYESPYVALSRRGMNIFVGGEFSHSVLEGDTQNQKTLLLIGDSSAKTLAVWLTPYYENVYLVSTKRYQGGPQEFKKIFRDYSITDVILTEEAGNFGETVYNGKIREFTP